MTAEIIITVGYNGAGKTSLAESYFATHHRLNRDIEGKGLGDLIPLLVAEIIRGKKRFILDNTYPTKESRKPIIEVGNEHNIPVRCLWLDTKIEDAQVNITTRMVKQYGKILAPSEISKAKQPNTFPPAVIFRYRKQFEKPTVNEGFAEVKKLKFKRRESDYDGKALILDYDGTLRQCKSGNKFPVKPDDVELLPGRREVLLRYQEQGYRLLGVSNQSGIAKGTLSEQDAIDCFERTNELLGVDIEYSFCPHRPAPISCWCRKPMPGGIIAFIEKYKLSLDNTIFVGDMKTDQTCAKRAGVKYFDATDFFP